MQATQALIPYENKAIFYAALTREIQAFADPVWFTAFGNFAACLKQHLPHTNWVGFYLAKDQELVLGPFQGLPACVRIAFGRGVCGTCARDLKTQLVPDVELFPGHIACDSASRSEIVIPIFRDEARTQLFGVLDIDSPILNRFDAEDQKGLEAIALQITKLSSLPASW